VQTVFTANKCIECDACVDICPTRCITFTAPAEDESVLRQQLSAPAINHEQALYIADGLSTGRVMVKDEDVCLHCAACVQSAARLQPGICKSIFIASRKLANAQRLDGGDEIHEKNSKRSTTLSSSLPTSTAQVHQAPMRCL
jgi:ferredoxin